LSSNRTGREATTETDEATNLPALAEQEPIVKFFAYQHLPPKIQSVSSSFASLAITIMGLPRSAERTVALRKLLESKDAAVRAAL
jgi:hypothetical protein